MSETALSEESNAAPRRTRAKSRSRTRKTRPPGPPPASELQWQGFAGVGLFILVVPYLGVALLAPDWTGAFGAALSEGLKVVLGQGAYLVPFLMLGPALHLLKMRAVQQVRLPWTLPLLLALVLLAQRMGDQGGRLGQALDHLLVRLVGPAGAWLTALAGVVFCMLALCRVGPKTAVEFAVALKLRALRALHAGLTGLWRRLRRPEPDTSLQIPVPPPAPPELWQEMDDSAEMPAPSNEGPQAYAPTVEPPEPSSDPPGETFEDSGEPAVEFDPIEPDEDFDSYEDLAVEAHAPETLADTPGTPSEEGAPPPRVPSLEEGVMEDPDGQLRLFPGPAPAPAATYKLPPLALLDEAPRASRNRPFEDKSQVLLDALDSFGVKARLLQIVRGPTVTRYELQPARGVKVSRFTSLTNDIALALASTAVRIEAPIPGKSAIGIEIPNDDNDLVVLKEILAAPNFTRSKGLTIALGKDLSGRPDVTNLQKMPHLLVAGTTGSGKSVCVNGLIISLLFRFTPRQLQMVMVDPKQVELSIYQGIPHLVGFAGEKEGEIIVDPKRAALALHQIVELMEERYRLFARSRVRNLEEYNQKAIDPLPWVVVIIDELADLMMVASKAVETSICRIAQKARAAGIHMVVATQRPSADVITGLIKVNIPSRIAFAVSSQVDSRVILDTGGAEHLLGKGDMLFLPVDASDPRRLQGAFVSNDEIQRVVEFWKAQSQPENLIELEVPESDPSGSDSDSGDEDDDLLQEALNVVLQKKQASASMLQTELKVGYARARRILNLMEKKGYVGPAEGSKPRKILYTGAPSA